MMMIKYGNVDSLIFEKHNNNKNDIDANAYDTVHDNGDDSDDDEYENDLDILL